MEGSTMSLIEQFWFAWPWMGLGMAVIMLFLLFGTNLFRSGKESRWLDPQWLAWIAMPAYLIHQFEEYACNRADDGYVIINQVFANTQGVLDLTNLPLAYFPEVNIALVWIGVPLSAFLCRWNPVVGLAPYGFILVNGLMHCLGSLSGAMPIDANPGFWTGTFIFLPLLAIVVYAALKTKFMSGGALAVALVAGALAHIVLGAAYAVTAVGGGVAALVVGAFAGVASIAFAWLGCKIFHVKYMPLIKA